MVNVILDSLGVGDEPVSAYAGAEEPRPEDIVAYEQDYVFGVGDVIRIGIFELLAENAPYVDNYQVTETGRITIPEVGMVTASGLTEAQLAEQIEDILKPTILLDPSVTVMLMQSQSKMFSISGSGVGGSGRQVIPRYNYRLREAIDSAGGIAQLNASNVYIIRNITGDESMFQPTAEITTADHYDNSTTKSRQPKVDKAPQQRYQDIHLKSIEPGDRVQPVEKKHIDEDELLELIAPYAKNKKKHQIVISSSEMVTESELRKLKNIKTPAMKYITASSEDGHEDNGERVEWIFDSGKWVAVRSGKRDDAEPKMERPLATKRKSDYTKVRKPLAPKEPVGNDFGWDQIGSGGIQTRLIKVPVDKLISGDPRYNILVKPGDAISVPLDSMGEFYVSGNLNASGPISLHGRAMTLKMAVAAAGGLGQLAHPQKVEITRRIDDNREVTVLVDLNKIAKGLQPDFFIKHNDLINVGTHGTSRWLAVLRNSFRASYGFGFVYDRNLASRDFGNDPFPGHISINSLFGD